MTIEEVAISTMWEITALVEVLERKGMLITKQEVLDMIQELRQREPTAIPPRRLGSQEIAVPRCQVRSIRAPAPSGRAGLS